MCHVNHILVMIKADRPAEGVIVTVGLALAVLVVANVTAAASPASARLLGLDLAIDKRAHSMIIQ